MPNYFILNFGTRQDGNGGLAVKRTIWTATILTWCVIILTALLPIMRKEPEPLPPEQSPLPPVQLPDPELEPEKPVPLQGADAAVRLTVWTSGELQETTLGDYLPGVLAGEMPAAFGAEALKAQAVAARTYILYKQQHGCRTHPEAVVCDDASCCKAWMPREALQERWGEDYIQNLEKMCCAVSDTDGLYLSYAGEPIQAVFHSSSAGKTESSGNLWKALPYLVSVESPETQEDVPNFVTEVEVSPEALKAAVSSVHPAADFSGEADTWLGGVYYNETGRVTYASLGGAAVSGTELREMFSLRSTCFTLSATETGFVFCVTGYGHGVGMSQYGAKVMAENGADFREILLHYYPGTQLSTMPDLPEE